jgi:hypothetical protein
VWHVNENYIEAYPCCARFVPGQGHKDATSYREHLDNILMSDSMYIPYNNHCHVRPLRDVCWFSGLLTNGSFKGKHFHERVLRQFGYIQDIPRDHVASAPIGMTLEQIDQVFLEEMEERMIDEEMRGATVVNPWDHNPG